MIWYWMVVFPCSNHLHMLDLQSLISIHMVTPSGLRSIALVTFFIYRFSSFYIIFMDGLVRCNPMQGHNQIRHLFSLSKNRNYYDESERNKSVEELYRQQHTNQTYEFVSVFDFNNVKELCLFLFL